MGTVTPITSKSREKFERLLTPGEVAAAFRVDGATVTRWAKAGRLRSIRTLGNHRRFFESQVLALLAECKQERTP